SSHEGLHSLTEPQFSGPTGLLMLRIVAGFAEHESNVKSERVARKEKQRAERGEPHKGGRRVFGYTRDFEPHPDEAPLVREAVARILAGEGSNTIAQDWNARGVRTAQGKEWVASNLRRMLRSPVHAGIRTHHGQLIDGTWPALVERERWEQLRSVLEGRTS